MQELKQRNGGTHRFNHRKEVVELIQKHHFKVQITPWRGVIRKNSLDWTTYRSLDNIL